MISWLLLFASSVSFEPIRIGFDLRALNDPNFDPDGCWEWTNETLCQAISADKVDILAKTLNNVATHVSKFVGVERVTSPSVEFTWDPLTFTCENADLCIGVVNRQLDDEVVADSLGFQGEDFPRTIGGVIRIPMLSIPAQAQDVDSIDRLFFMTLMHEFFHIMGLTGEWQESWIDRRTGTFYENFMSSVVIDDREIYSINTPEIVNNMNARYGTDDRLPGGQLQLSFAWDIDVWTPYTDPDHWRIILDQQDIMAPIMAKNAIITNLTLAALYDTGWYEIDFSYNEEDKGFYGRHNDWKFTRIIDSYPDNAFPPEYLCPDNRAKLCGADPRYIHGCEEVQEFNCTDNEELCRFVDPARRSESVWVDITREMVPLAIPVINCQDENNINDDRLSVFSSTSFCAVSSINGLEKGAACYKMDRKHDGLEITIGKEAVMCTKRGEEVKLSNGVDYVVCPDPDVAGPAPAPEETPQPAPETAEPAPETAQPAPATTQPATEKTEEEPPNTESGNVGTMVAIGSVAGVGVLTAVGLVMKRRIQHRRDARSESVGSMTSALMADFQTD